MKGFTLAWLILIGIALYITFFATFADNGAIMVGCSQVVQTRGGTICLDRAYMR